MKYRHTIIVPYQDVDATRRLRLYAMENYLLNIAGKVADEMGIGIPALLPMIPGMYAYKAIFAIMSYMSNIELADKAIYIDQFVTNIVYVIGILLSLAIGSIMPMFVFTRIANSLTRN